MRRRKITHRERFGQSGDGTAVTDVSEASNQPVLIAAPFAHTGQRDRCTIMDTALTAPGLRFRVGTEAATSRRTYTID